MSNASLLVIESRHANFPVFSEALRNKGFRVEQVASGSEAVECLMKEKSIDVAVINAATLRTSGKRICKSLREKAEELPLVVVLSPESNDTLEANTVLVLPFTVQKLINRIRHLLPPEGKNILHVGPIRLSTESGVVRCLGKQSRLTPRLVRLLTILLRRKGEVVERKELFCQAWETNYTVDTRTLDVHISWLRHAIEVDPERPRFLKTVRGVGYRLDI